MKLYTYKTNEYKKLKLELDSQDVFFISMAEIDSKNQIIEALKEERVFIDLTNVIRLLKRNDDNSYFFEKYLYMLSSDTVIVINKEFADEVDYFFPNLVDEQFEYYLEEDEVIEELKCDDKSSLDKVVKITDLSNEELIGSVKNLV